MCIVVSPLIALMQDQRGSCQTALRIVRELRDRKIPCCYLSSSQSASEYRSVMGALKHPKTLCNALFVTPERFQVPEFFQVVQNLHEKGKIILIAIDEAHCISTFLLSLLCDLQVGPRLPLRLSRIVLHPPVAPWNPHHGAVRHCHIRLICSNDSLQGDREGHQDPARDPQRRDRLRVLRPSEHLLHRWGIPHFSSAGREHGQRGQVRPPEAPSSRARQSIGDNLR